MLTDVAVSNRAMCGVHYRMDSVEGLHLGETVGVRMLQQVRDHTYPTQTKSYERVF